MTHLHHKISALIDGELTPNARTRALAHARTCAQCRQEIAETLEVKRRVNRLAPVEVSSDLLDVVGAIRPPAEPRTPPRPRLLRRVLVGAGSFSAVVIALAYAVGAPEAAQAKPVSPAVEEFTAEFADTTGLAPLSDPAVGGLTGDTSDASADVPPQTFGGVNGSVRPKLPPVGAEKGSTTQPPVTWQSGDDPEALDELGRALDAPQEVGYAGALVIRSFLHGRVDASRLGVQHVPGQGTRFDVLRADGKVRGESFVKTPGVLADGLDTQSLQTLSDAYDLGIDGRQQVVGREATVVSASQHGQVVARFWIDVATGLLLQRTMYADGQLVRWSGYVSLEVNRHSFMPHLPPELATPKLTAVPRSVVPALNDKGWTCPEQLAGHFRLSFLHQLDADGDAMRAEYTDGLTTVSVFEQRGALDTSSLAGFRTTAVDGNPVYVRSGLPTVAVWESAGTVFTLVTDAPQQLADGLVARLPHLSEATASGVTSRIEHGLSRLVSAAAP